MFNKDYYDDWSEEERREFWDNYHRRRDRFWTIVCLAFLAFYLAGVYLHWW